MGLEREVGCCAVLRWAGAVGPHDIETGLKQERGAENVEGKQSLYSVEGLESYIELD